MKGHLKAPPSLTKVSLSAFGAPTSALIKELVCNREGERGERERERETEREGRKLDLDPP